MLMTPVSNISYSSRLSSGTSSSLCKRALKRVLGGLDRVLPSSLRERGVSDGTYVGSLLWLLAVSGGEKSDAGVSMF